MLDRLSTSTRVASLAAPLSAGRTFTHRDVDGDQRTDLGKAEYHLDRALARARAGRPAPRARRLGSPDWSPI